MMYIICIYEDGGRVKGGGGKDKINHFSCWNDVRGGKIQDMGGDRIKWGRCGSIFFLFFFRSVNQDSTPASI